MVYFFKVKSEGKIMSDLLRESNFWKERILRNLGVPSSKAKPRDFYDALTLALNRELAILAEKSENHILSGGKKFVCYLSMEYLLGKLLDQSLLALNAKKSVAKALSGLGANPEKVFDCDISTQLGNGGLGRLAACFFDSAATMRMPMFGYGLLYRCGIYRQDVKKGKQVELPDLWLADKNVALRKNVASYEIGFGGVIKNGGWRPHERIPATASDIMLAGYGANFVATLRLFEAARKDSRAPNIWKTCANITDFLYPPDNTNEGRRLRLRQEHLLCSASIADILARFARTGKPFSRIEEYLAVQLNDTHPTLAIPEFMLRLVQDYGFSQEAALTKAHKVCAYTNHTLMAEALEKIGIDLMGRELPAHLEIIKKIDAGFTRFASPSTPKDKLAKIKIINEKAGYVNMGNICMAVSHKVNGVAKLHSDLLKNAEFCDISRLFPDRFINETNGISFRKWLLEGNPALALFITELIGDGWITDANQLKRLLEYKDDRRVLARLMQIKRVNKAVLAEAIGEKIDTQLMLDCQTKRIHEYKRQLLNLFQIIHRYNRILDGDIKGMQGRTHILAGKAPPTYKQAKDILSLALGMQQRINADRRCKGLLKIIFVPNYNVDIAKLIINAADLSEQISLAGTEASGTGNMKYTLNGALTIGTLDGANIEIAKAVGRRNIFIFGLTAPQAAGLKAKGYDPKKTLDASPALQKVIKLIESKAFGDHAALLENLLHGGDKYMALADFESYIKAHESAEKLYTNQIEWARSALINIANCGYFSSDRAIAGYAADIWKIKEV